MCRGILIAGWKVSGSRSMRKIRKYLRGMLAGVIVMFGIAGCQSDVLSREIVFTTGLTASEIFKIGGLACTVSEARLLLINVKNQYEEAFGKEIWEQNIEGKPFQAYVKDMVKNQLAQLKCMVLFANEEKIALTEEEEKLLREAAIAYCGSLDEKEKEVLQITEEDVWELYKSLAVSGKLYDMLTQEVEEEISDAEAKVIVVWHIFKDCKESTDQERAEKKKELSDIRERLLTQGADFASLAEEHSDDAKLEYAFGRDEMEQSFETAAFALETGEISDIVETMDGYHLIKCVRDYDEEKTARNKTELLKRRKQEAFDKEYAVFIKGLLSEFNEGAWEDITFDQFEGIDNKNLYEVYEEYWETGEKE